jgi:hypothetical protein
MFDVAVKFGQDGDSEIGGGFYFGLSGEKKVN